MESVLGRYRNLIILVGVLFLQVLGLAVQVKRSADAENTRLIRIWAVDTITPFERALVWAQNSGKNIWHNYFFLRGVRAENRQLKEQIEQMRLEQVRLSEDAEQAHRLQSLLAFKEQTIAKTVAAQVIGSSGSDLSRSIYIDKGSNDGVGLDMAVITAGGIVGKVLRVYPSTTLVLMINDQTSGVGAMLEKSRLQGVLRGTADGAVILERVMSDEQVTPGETVISSGGDQIFPKGLPVGTVTKVSPGREMFLNIQVKPAADLSRLEEVLVITEKQEQNPVAETGGRVRAADILAQRLPSVPDRPAVDTATAAATGNKVIAPVPATSPGAKPSAPVQSSVKPEAAQHPATPSIGKVPPSPTGAAPGSTKAVSTGGTQEAPGNGQAAASQVPKKSVPKAAASEPALNGDSPNAEGSIAAVPAPKSTTTQPKRPVPQPSPQPPATEDDPH
ncbi:MAG: rod shape-determining protein MreC [Candidatus Sulfotelmatobacter sp.]|jgi:rod shape-determining protein MreC